MGKKKREERPGYGKLLDAWSAPDDAGDPVGCLATSFTFSPAFFEEECLARFLHLESDPNEDGPVYLVEREEKLAQLACAVALVDQHHCKGSRNLRWDLLPARLSQGLLHAKVSLLFWSQLIRIIIGSANLTDDGYRRNQEVFGVLDFKAGGESPLSFLADTVSFLRAAVTYSTPTGVVASPASDRWSSLLDRVLQEGQAWGFTDEQLRRNGVRVHTLFSGPGYPNLFDQLGNTWPGDSPPHVASVVSPFFDVNDGTNGPAAKLWRIVRQRGEATVEFHVAAEDVPGEDAVFVYAPSSLLAAQPGGRASVATEFFRLQLPAERPLHAKGIWLENERWSVYTIGSSNFTSAGTGIAKAPNLEANVAYMVDGNRDPKARKMLDTAFPESEYIDLAGDIRWKPLSGEGEDTVAEELPLPKFFADAVYDCSESNKATVRLSFAEGSPSDWEIITESQESVFFTSQQWHDLDEASSCELPWESDRPPSGFWVIWTGSNGTAWWPVNVLTGSALPPPDELKNLPLEVLINILSSARPLHRVLRDFLRRREREKGTSGDVPIVDPHKRVDTSQFLLQRTRRISWALNALRQRLERPAVTEEFLRWRLHGPVGVMALAKALSREAKSDEERAFLMSELALELARVRPESATGCLPPEKHMELIREVIVELRASVFADMLKGPNNLCQYVQSVFETVTA